MIRRALSKIFANVFVIEITTRKSKVYFSKVDKPFNKQLIEKS